MPVAWLAVFIGLFVWLAGVFIVYSDMSPVRPLPDPGRVNIDPDDEAS